MYLSQITFGKHTDNRCDESQRDVAEEYLATLLHNGQMLGDYLLAPCNGILVAYARVARPDALAKRHHSKWGLTSLENVVKTFGRVPECGVIQDGVPARIASWRRSSSLYLFTHAFDDTSPVCCGDTGRPIPLYLLPISDMTREHLYFWAGTYRDHDRLWLDSGSLEIPAYRQMADPRSELSASGRGFCREIESATGKKTFYYLHRYYGRKRGEQDRACPMCGRQWRTSTEKSEATPFCEFDFRCVRCRLVSHCADSYDDERHAVIGEYRKPLPARRAKR
jgi:predicted  nucleic acid-binding Zn ribbon protein